MSKEYFSEGFENELDRLLSIGSDPEESDEKQLIPEPEVQPEPETEAPEEDDDEVVSEFKAMSPEDQAKAFEAMQRKLDVLGGFVSQQYQQNQGQREPQAQPQQQQFQPQQQPVAQPAQGQEPYLVTNQDLAPLAQQMQHIQRVQAQNLWNQEAANYRQAEEALRTKYKDFDSVIPEHERVKAFDQLARQGQFGNNWQQRFEYVYKAFAYDKVAARADELQQKRETKRAANTKAAATVPPSGAVFQQPAVQLDRSKRGYGDAVKATSEALRAL